jgi:two-component system sensor histidine kinase YesM
VRPRVRTIRSSLIWAFSLVISLGILVLGAFSLILFQRALIDETQKANTQLVSQLNRILDGYIGYMQDLALVVWKNPDVDAYMSGPPAGDPQLRRQVVRFLEGIPQIRPDIDSLVLTRPGGEILTSAPDRRLNPWLDRAEPPEATVSAARIENLFDDRYQWVVSLVQGQPHSSPSGAWLQVNLNYAVIDDLCRKIQLGRSGYVFIVNAAGELVYHPRQQLVYSGLKSEKIDEILKVGQGQLEARVGDRNLVYTVATSLRTRWSVVAVSYLDELLVAARNLGAVVLAVALACLLLTTVLAWRVSLRISRPIEALRRSMRAVETGDFDVVIDVEANNEVGELARDCDIAIGRVRDLMRQSLVDQEAKRRQDLLMLQSQINPHFLYNTLDSIIWMVELGRAPDAIRMTSTLAQFFRLGISRGPHVISLGHELEHVVSYLSIQKMRYGEKLEYQVDVDPDVMDTPVLKLLLQPLVENALYHGIKEREGPGVIRVTGARVGDTVEVKVADDGVGMTQAKLSSLLLEPEHDAREHIGLRNVDERLRLTFGPQFGLSFASSPGLGTTVTLILPARSGI